MTNPNVTVSDVLRRAAEIHAERGGCKETIRDVQGRVCLMGAMAAAFCEVHGAAWDEGVQRQHFSAYLAMRTALHGEEPAQWNDRPDTTDRDVQKFLLRVADEVEFGGVS